MPDHPPTGLMLVAPSMLTVGEPFALRIKALTDPHHIPASCYTGYPRLGGPFNQSPRGITYMDNAATRWEGDLQISSDGPLTGPAKVRVRDMAGAFEGDSRAIGEVGDLSFDEPGVYVIEVRDGQHNLTGRSNVIEVSAQEPEARLWWGDLHSQTYFSDGLRCPEELYHFARHEAFLDIFAMADHSEWLTDHQWDYFTDVTNAANDPGRFVTFVGLEWTNKAVGHRNVYYSGDGGPILRSTEDDLETVYRAAREHGALVIPHHTSNVEMGVKWDSAHDPEHARLVEIYSIWGNSEMPAERGNTRPIRTHGGEQAGQHVVDALARGYRLGFVGGGDIHDGRPGDDLHTSQATPPQYRNLWRQGIMGVWAKELTRASVWDALWNRRVLAASNVRVPVRFSVNGVGMGGEATSDGTREITVGVASEVPVSRVEIFRNGELLAQSEPDETVVDWRLEDQTTEPAYYYARITRADGELAWASPVWVDWE